MTTRSDRKSADDTPWAVDARHAMQAATGDQLKVTYEVPRELLPELNALRFRMDERGENKQQRRGIASWCRPSSAGICPCGSRSGTLLGRFVPSVDQQPFACRRIHPTDEELSPDAPLTPQQLLGRKPQLARRRFSLF